MKQNEKILVYAVTGFLVVILMLAVLLGTGDGKRGAGAAGSTGGNSSGRDVAALSLEDLLGVASSGAVADARGDKGTGAGHGDADKLAANGDPAGGAAPALGDKALLTNVQLLPPTAASMVTEKLGLSRRDRDYRIVRVQPKDTLSTLAQKWCGKTDGYLEMAQGLNEELGTLHVGQEITLPWIDDEVLLAAINARAGKTDAVDAAPATGGGDAHVAALDADAGKDTDGGHTDGGHTDGGHTGKKDAGKKDSGAPDKKAPEAKPASGTRKITLKAGDTLWKIAEREVGKKAAGRFISQIRELNPGIDPDHLREGIEIRLPATESHPEAGRPTN